MKTKLMIALAVHFLMVQNTYADDAQTSTAAPGPSTQGDITHDYITFKYQTGKIFCKYDPNKDEILACKEPSYFAKSDTKIIVQRADEASGLDLVAVKRSSCTEPNCLRADDGNLYVVSEKKMLLYLHERDGYAWGMLTTPYKYYPGSGHFTSEASIGPFLGYTWDFERIAVTPLASIGFAPITVQTTQGTTTTNESVTAYHWAIGVLFSVQKRTGFQAGIVYGKDYTTSSTPYTFNQKGWFALALGYSFQ